MSNRKQSRTQAQASAKTGLSERSARRIEHGQIGVSQRKERHWRTHADPFAGGWEEEIVSRLERQPRLDAATLFETRVLVVDDDASLRELLTSYLRREGFDVQRRRGRDAMFDWLAHHQADILILDLMLPGEDGLSLARRLRTQTEMPIIMLSARGEDIDRIVGLEVGADDYLAKPFNPRELLARIRAVLRRHARPRRSNRIPDVAQFGPYRLDLAARQLLRDGKPVTLTGSEFDLLRIFVEHPNRCSTATACWTCSRAMNATRSTAASTCRWRGCGPRSSRTRSSLATSAPSGAEATCLRRARRSDALRSLLPRSLFGRVLLTLVLTFGSFAVISFATMVYYALRPVVQRSTADLAALMELSARTLVQLPEDLRDDYRDKLLHEYQLWLRTEREPPRQLRYYFFPYLIRLSQALSERLDRRCASRAISSTANAGSGSPGYATGQGLGGLSAGTHQHQAMGGATCRLDLRMLLLLVTAAVIANRVTSPLTRLSQAAEEVAKGRSPEPLPEGGPRELASLARQFNADQPAGARVAGGPDRAAGRHLP
jgi:DNA-binding response OmpR family regulator/HAMP domain-containing protein